MIDWDAYRADYASLDWAGQQAFYDEVWHRHPDQRHYDAAACRRFLEVVRPGSVLELGGWRGELAAEMLAALPDISRWRNVEVCRGAVDATVCTDPRYTAEVPERWPWETTLRGDALVLSHIIEHMTFGQINDLLFAAGAGAAFVQSPLSEMGQDWSGYQGSHVLREGWRAVVGLFEAHGLKHDPSLDAPDVRCFR